MKKILTVILAILLAAIMCVSCGDDIPAATTGAPETTMESVTPDVTPEQTPNESTPDATTTVGQDESTPENTESETAPGTETLPSETKVDETSGKETEPDETTLKLNEVDISEYKIVYGSRCSDYDMRAASYIRDSILALTGVKLPITTDTGAAAAHEIVIGETKRDISAALDADTEGVEFSLMAKDGHIALEGDYYVIAAAAYYFVETYVEGEGGNIPAEPTVCQPIVEKPNNYIFLIGDGMGLYQTLLFDIMDSTTVSYSDGEDLFYGYMLPYMGLARTNSLSGLTDSAAAGTALATGYKTSNGAIGKQAMGRDVKSLTEIAGDLGMATAVMSTEAQTGATPSAFSAHAPNRNDSNIILESQAALVEKYGTIIKCNYNYYDASGIKTIEKNINDTLTALSANENGFFLMYEEAYIDKHCHNNDINNTFNAVVRFNQAIAVFMEYAFYNPDTFLLITADHETGKLLPNGSGGFSYGSGDHSEMYVPVFTYGIGGELFDGRIVENIQIPKTIASFWGYELSGYKADEYPALAK